MDWNTAGAVGEIMGQFNACNQLYATDATIRKVLLKDEALSVEEAEQLYSYVDMYCNAWVTARKAFNQGLIDEALYSGSVRDVGVALSRWPNMRQPRLGNSTGLFHGHGW